MAKSFHTTLSLCLLLLFTSSCLARSDRFNQCQLDRIKALEPDNRVKSEAGLTETWNFKEPELQCAGVSVIRRTIEPNGLHLPSFSPAPQLIFIEQGKGVIGLAFPGCAETYEEPQSRQQQRRGSSSPRQQRDSHQKIRYFNRGDVIAIPPGIPYWSYNYGDEPLVAISLLDTSNFANQLDPTPRIFYLAGNPELEFPESQKEPRQQTRGGRRHGQHQQEEEEEEGGSVLGGFASEFLSHSLNTDRETAKKLQSPDDERRQIVKVKNGLSIISSEWQEQEEEEEEEERGRHEGGRRHRREEEEEERRPRHRRGEEEEVEVEEEEEDEPGSRGGRWRRRRHEWRHGPHREEEEEEEEEDEGRRRHRERSPNGLEETLCTLKIHENIAHPSRADLYNPKAGRISTVNSLTLPILRQLQLSAEYVVLYRDGINLPHWNHNANSVLYVIRGRGRVRVVNCQGEAVLDDEVRKGQLVVVPQNFAVAEQAKEDGFEYIVFKTSDLNAVSHVKQVFRAIPSEVLANAFRLRPQEVSELKYSGNRGRLVSPPQSQRPSLAMVI